MATRQATAKAQAKDADALMAGQGEINGGSQQLLAQMAISPPFTFPEISVL